MQSACSRRNQHVLALSEAAHAALAAALAAFEPAAAKHAALAAALASSLAASEPVAARRPCLTRLITYDMILAI